MYRVEVDWAPPYELVTSLKAYVSKPEHRTLDLGSEWLRQVRQRLQPDLAAELSSVKALSHVNLIELLICECPGERSIAAFLQWLGALSLGELYELLAAHVAKPRSALPEDLNATREDFLRLLTGWDEQYFRQVDPAILTGLQADADAKRALVDTMAADELVELATSGLHYVPQPEPQTVLLVPQYHFRPWNTFALYRHMRLIEYPADVLEPLPGEPPLRLLRIARVLSDESRLRILRFLARGPRSFTEVVQFSGLSKSTVHHHMVSLRAAGLVRVREEGEKLDTYILRPVAVDELSETLRAYLTGNESPTGASKG